MQDQALEGVVKNAEVVADATESSTPVEELKEETASEADDSESSTDVAEETEDKPEPTEAEIIRDKMQKRINRQTAANKREAEQRQAAEQRIKALEDQLAASVQDAGDGAPNEDDYNTYEEYQSAVVDHQVKTKLEAAQREQAQQRLETEQRQQMESAQKAFNVKEEAFRAENPDYNERATVYDEVAKDLIARKGVGDPTISSISNLIMHTDHAPAIIHELGSNPDLMEDIANMSPVDAMREMFKLEESVKGRKPKKTQAKPTPIKSLSGKSTPKKDPTKMSGAELLKEIGIK